MMRSLLIVALIVVAAAVRAQTFEGSITMKMKFEVTDPAAKKQMEELKKKSKDPETLVKIQQMKDKMNDPEMKKAFGTNPGMKAEMEMTIGMLSGKDLGDMMPQKFVLKLKGSNSLAITSGGVMENEDVLFLSAKDQTFSINHDRKMFRPVVMRETRQSKPTITKTSEAAMILSYHCTKYIIEIVGKQKTVFSYWATTEIKDIDPKALAKQKLSDEQDFYFPEVEGFPMRVETSVPGMGTLTLETTEVKRGSIPDSDFTIPAGYTARK
jgi:hypothetical protein